jgi:hypothetical protein
MIGLLLGIIDVFNKTLPAGFALKAALQKPSGEIEVLESLNTTEAATDARIRKWQDLIDDANA